MCKIDTDHATDALAKILYKLIDINEGGNDLADAAREVEKFFRLADYDFGKRTLEKLEEERIDFDYDTVHGMYRALLKISKIAHVLEKHEPPIGTIGSICDIADETMKKARGEA